jgi:hypothetical protein
MNFLRPFQPLARRLVRLVGPQPTPSGKLLPAQRRAQAFVEFALALPILLMMVFGVMEFGRLIQAWLALENGARFATRYAITGNYNPVYCAMADAAVDNYHGKNPADADSYTKLDLLDGAADCIIPVKHPTTGAKIDKAEEKGGELVDAARLPSIRDEAKAGATGIALNEDAAVSGDYQQFITDADNTLNPYRDNHGNPAKEGFFAISTCSNRYNADGDTQFRLNGYPGTDIIYYSPIPVGANNDEYRYPVYCQQVKRVDSSVTRNVDDAGGPGDRVRIVLTYRHNLITPFLNSWWPTLRLTTEREGIVEKFRVSRVTGLSGQMIIAATHTYTPTLTSTASLTFTPTITGTTTDTPTSTLTPSSTVTKSLTPTQTATKTPTLGCFVTAVNEPLTFVNDGNTGKGYEIESVLKNAGPYAVEFQSANLNSSNIWHNAIQASPGPIYFNMYSWYNPDAAGLNVTDKTGWPVSDTLKPGYVGTLGPLQSSNSNFKWTFRKTPLFWITPYVGSYPNTGAANVAPLVTQEGRQNFYWANEFSGTINYNVLPAATGGATKACSLGVTGYSGPAINPTITSNFSGINIKAAVYGHAPTANQNSVDWVYFFVYDNTGKLVHWTKDTASQWCAFTDCNPRKPGVDYWYLNSNGTKSDLIKANVTYTIAMLTRNKDTSKKSTLITVALNTVTYWTNTPKPTNTSTSIPPSPTNTVYKSPTNTPVTPTKTNTPITPSPTNTVYVPPTITLTPTKTSTPVVCLTPIEMGGCRKTATPTP